jgi:hypothetical protein
LPVAKLLPSNGAGAPGVAPDAVGLEHGYAAMTKQQGPGGTTLMPNSAATGGAYPLVKVDYAMVPTAGITATKARHISQFLSYAASGGQTGAALAPRYLPLPAALRAQTQTVAATMEKLASTPRAKTSHGQPPSTTPATAATTSQRGTTQPDNGGSTFGGSAGTGSDLTGSDGSTSPATDVAHGGGTGNVTPPTTQSLGGGEHSLLSQLKPLAFLGGNHELVLPFVVGIGLLALVSGPLLTLRAKRRVGTPPSSSSLLPPPPTTASLLPPPPPLAPPAPPAAAS